MASAHRLWLTSVVLLVQYWPDKPSNHTLLNQRMVEQVVTVNDIFDYRTPYDVVLAKQFPGASFAVYNVNGLVRRPFAGNACGE